MPAYKHTQYSYILMAITLAVFAIFVSIQLTARAEPPSVDSGTNLAVTATMVLILFCLASFTKLTTSIDNDLLRISFGFGVPAKKILLREIASAQSVRNRWYYGWGIKIWFWPYMWIYNVSGLNAVEIIAKNKKIYRIGTDEPEKLAGAIRQAANL